MSTIPDQAPPNLALRPHAITLRDVAVEADGRLILQEVACSLTERRIGIVGPNGSGKSTFVRLLNGLVRPSRGAVTIGGLDTVRDVKAVRRRVGFVFQNPDSQIVFPIVEDDLAFGLRNRGVASHAARESARALLERYGLGRLAQSPSHVLSGGEKQLVALLGVLIMQPDLIVLDEPTTMLDLRNRNRIAAEIAALAQPAIVATHDLDLASSFERVLVIAEGRIVADDEPKAAIAWYRSRLG